MAREQSLEDRLLPLDEVRALPFPDDPELAAPAVIRGSHEGAFGIDAFLHRWKGSVELNPLSEINARYTMDWALSFGQRARPDLQT